ncbi:MAG: HEAT repeat domain-containing protein [Candidatus Hydrogenedentes bacterium]|nr:HEAT repeat domain-containing protein [Candidatus Hydrogenedentota bacterium]
MDNVYPSNPNSVTRAQTSAADVLIRMTRSARAEERIQGLLGLVQLSPIERLDVIVSALCDSDARVRDVAAASVSALDPEQACERILTILTAGAPRMKAGVDAALAHLPPSLETEMLATLESAERTVELRCAAAYCLGRMDSRDAASALVKLARDNGPPLCVACANALVEINDPAAERAFEAWLRHPNGDMRIAAARGVARIGGPRTVALLSQVALFPTETDQRVRREAVALLGMLGDPAAIPPLIQAMKRYLSVRRHAAIALQRLTKQDFGPEPALWEQWYSKEQSRKTGVPPEPGYRPPQVAFEYLQ